MKHNTLQYDDEEREILDAIEQDALVSRPLTDKDRQALRDVARNTFAKSRSITSACLRRDLIHLKAKAAHESIPYQTLITSVLHKYSNRP
jgi:predicted DNA binding CopG/RHH family protein